MWVMTLKVSQKVKNAINQSYEIETKILSVNIIENKFYITSMENNASEINIK